MVQVTRNFSRLAAPDDRDYPLLARLAAAPIPVIPVRKVPLGRLAR